MTRIGAAIAVAQEAIVSNDITVGCSLAFLHVGRADAEGYLGEDGGFEYPLGADQGNPLPFKRESCRQHSVRQHAVRGAPCFLSEEVERRHANASVKVGDRHLVLVSEPRQPPDRFRLHEPVELRAQLACEVATPHEHPGFDVALLGPLGEVG